MLVTNKIAAVEKLAGKINVQIKIAGMMTGKNPDLKCLIYSCFLLSTRARYMIRKSLATSEL